MNDSFKRPPLAHASGMPITDDPSVQSPRLSMCSQDQSAGDLR
jgi:hypothetical protein